MTSKLDMVKARNLSIISVLATAVLGAGLVFTSTINQPPTVEGADVAGIYSGRNTSFVLDNEGALWAKGVNSVGQLGVGDFYNKSEWTQVALPEEESVSKVSVGETHVAVLTEGQEIYTFGDNRSGILGNGTNAVSLSPVRVVASHTYTMLTAGEGFVIALGTDGKLYSWGKNDKGQLGLGDKENRDVPTLMPWSSGTILSLKAGKDFALALTDDGKVHSWGANDKGQLGVGDKKERLTPTVVPLEERLTFVNTNLTSSTVVALSEDGKLFTWGANDKGQLGNGTDWREEIRLEAERVENEKKKIAEADAERKEKLINECVAEKKKKWEKENPPVWEELPEPETPTMTDEDAEEEPGEPEFGWVQPEAPDFKPSCEKEVSEYFTETDTSGIVAREIKEPTLKPDGDKPEHIGGSLRFIYASVGSQNGAAVSTNRKLHTWGTDDKGQNGNGLEDPSTHTQTPKLIQAEDDWTEYSKAEVSNGWSVALTDVGNLTVWGSSSSGALSTAGTKTLTPTIITDGVDTVFSDITVGANTGYATSVDSINYSWGGNSSAVLGYETSDSKNDEIREIGSSLTIIAPSGSAVIALGSNRNLYGWGVDRENAFGEATANETSQQTPRRLQQITQFSDVSAGYNFTAATDLKGKVWVWGSNNSGITGAGAGGNILYPVKVEVSEDRVFNKVQATKEAVYAFTEANTLTSWGAGRGFTDIEVPVSAYDVFSTVKGVSLLTEDGELYRTTYEASSTDQESGSDGFVEQFTKMEGKYNAVSQSITGQSIAQTADNEFIIWGTGLPEDLEEAWDGTYKLELPLPEIQNISLSSTHYMMFDTNKILWMWGEEPSGTFKNKGYVSIPQSNIFTPQKADS